MSSKFYRQRMMKEHQERLDEVRLITALAQSRPGGFFLTRRPISKEEWDKWKSRAFVSGIMAHIGNRPQGDQIGAR